MFSTEIKESTESRKFVKAGVDLSTRLVGITLGALGKTVTIENGAKPMACDDALKVARAIRPKNKFERMGSDYTRMLAEEMDQLVGDNRSTSVVLYGAFVGEIFALTAVDSSKIADLRVSLTRALNKTIDTLSGMKKPLADEDIEKVATISCLDPVAGKLIADAFKQVGINGKITVSEAKGASHTLELIKGLKFDNGFLSRNFVFDMDRNRSVIKSPKIIVTDRVIKTNEQIAKFYPMLMDNGYESVVIIATNIEGEALASMASNNRTGNFMTLAIRAPYFGQKRSEFLKDICALTGATFMSEEMGLKVEDVKMENLGTCDEIEVNESTTTIKGGVGDVSDRVKNLEALIEGSDSEVDKDFYRERLANLDGGMAVIGIGALSEDEFKTKKSKVEDAIRATRAATQGIVIGGGSAIAKIAKGYENSSDIGEVIFSRVLLAPIEQMARNSGLNPYKVVHEVQSADVNTGYNFITRQLCDLDGLGIFDSFKGARIGLEKALSYALIAMTSDASVTVKIDKQPE